MNSYSVRLMKTTQPQNDDVTEFESVEGTKVVCPMCNAREVSLLRAENNAGDMLVTFQCEKCVTKYKDTVEDSPIMQTYTIFQILVEA